MANQEQLDILKQGVQAWNAWRAENPGVEIDLSRADLSGADLSRANLRGANLNSVILRDADLSGADLLGVILIGATIIRANLRGANLIRATLNDTTLRDADLSGAILAYTVFGGVDLSTVKGLEMGEHAGPLTIGIDTILRSGGQIPEVFLRGAGVPDSIIEAIPSLVGSLKPIDYYSCFISYSSKDEGLARRLYADLQSNHVRCWFAPEDMKIGDEIRVRIDESIRV